MPNITTLQTLADQLAPTRHIVDMINVMRNTAPSVSRLLDDPLADAGLVVRGQSDAAIRHLQGYWIRRTHDDRYLPAGDFDRAKTDLLSAIKTADPSVSVNL